MAMSIEWKHKITGLKEVEKSLDSLTDIKFRKAALSEAGKASMERVLRAAILLAPTRKPSASATWDAYRASKGLDNDGTSLKDDIKMRAYYNMNAAKALTKRGKLRKNKEAESVIVISTGKTTEDYAFSVHSGREKQVVIYDRDGELRRITLGEMTPTYFMSRALDMYASYIPKVYASFLRKNIQKQLKRQARAIARANRKR